MIQCSHVLKNGNQCKKKSRISLFCHIHVLNQIDTQPRSIFRPIHIPSIQNTLISIKYIKSRECGHDFCLLSDSESCCYCGDVRDYPYTKYMDSRKIITCSRQEHYCRNCTAHTIDFFTIGYPKIYQKHPYKWKKDVIRIICLLYVTKKNNLFSKQSKDIIKEIISLITFR